MLTASISGKSPPFRQASGKAMSSTVSPIVWPNAGAMMMASGRTARIAEIASFAVVMYSAEFAFGSRKVSRFGSFQFIRIGLISW